MCQYRYHLYLNCGHHCIECMRPCARRYWSAGLNGILSLCAPYIIMPSKEWKGPPEEEPPRPVDFLAFTGHCSKCHIAKPKVSHHAPQIPFQQSCNLVLYPTASSRALPEGSRERHSSPLRTRPVRSIRHGPQFRVHRSQSHLAVPARHCEGDRGTGR